jgi:glycosyltransferase involved in cell wall biosynthesis
MRLVYDNIIFSLQKAGGISVYWFELIKRLSRVHDSAIYYQLDNNNIFARQLPVPTRRESVLPVSIVRCAPFLSRLPGGSIFHSSYYRVSLQRDVKNVVTAHDFTAERVPDRPRRGLNILQKRFALSRAAGIICVSQNTRDDLLALYPGTRAPITVIHNGVSEGFHPLPADAALTGRFEELRGTKVVLFVGTRDVVKNFRLAVQVLASLENGYRLVLIGGGALSEEEARLLERSLPGRFHHYLGVSEPELNLLYNKAHCLLYPSSYEGFGLPVIEAMRAGCPVVALRASSIPEVAGGAGLLADAADREEFVAKVASLEDAQLRAVQVEKGLRRAQEFSWDRCFEQTYEFYATVASQP